MPWSVPQAPGSALHTGSRSLRAIALYVLARAADLGAIGSVGGTGTACCLPMVNVVWDFGRQR